jgi:hypothetical protein
MADLMCRGEGNRSGEMFKLVAFEASRCNVSNFRHSLIKRLISACHINGPVYWATGQFWFLNCNRLPLLLWQLLTE